MKRFNKKILISFIIAIVAFVSITVVVSAAILMTFTRGNIQVTTSNVAIETSYTAKEGTDNSLNFEGDEYILKEKSISLKDKILMHIDDFDVIDKDIFFLIL